MASVYESEGVLTCAATINGRRRVFRLGRVDPHEAREHITSLEAGDINAEAVAWVASLPLKLKARLRRVGLIDPEPTLADLIAYSGQRKLSVASSTQAGYQQVYRNLLEFFGRDQELTQVTEADAVDFLHHLQRELAPTTAAKRCDRAREMFAMGVQKRWIHRNPFESIKGGPRSNKEREQYVPIEVIEGLVKRVKCPQRQLQLLLARVAGLACPSEVLALRIADVHWDRHRMTIYKRKTRRHRECPIFPRLHEPLRAACEHGKRYVIHDAAVRAHTNPGTWLAQQLESAGIAPWPRRWHNLRSSAIKDACAAGWSANDVANWFGASVAVIQQHYHARSLDDAFLKASELPKTKPERKT